MRAAVIVTVISACGGSHAEVDAAPPDTSTIDAGPCGADTFFTGEIVDWDSTETQFCGEFGAVLQIRGDPSRTSHTNPNGRFQLCLTAAATTLVDVMPPTAASECTNPKSTYTIPAVMIASQSVIALGSIVSAREFTVARAPAFGFNASAAQVLVHVDGTPRAVSIDVTHDPTQAFDGTTWALGSTGVNVYFPNVDPTVGSAVVTVSGGATGTGSVPIIAGTFTWLTVVAN